MQFTRAVLSRTDRDRLRRFISAHERRLTRERDALALLSARLERAEIVGPHEVPPEAVTMHSQIRMQQNENGRAVINTVTLPLDAQVEAEAPLLRVLPAAALLGAREGDEMAVPSSGGRRHARIEKVLFQPEGAARRARNESARFYDEVDLRLMDTFPASDAVARY
jgi:regulator of nucleoside diphosphate kinase